MSHAAVSLSYCFSHGCSSTVTCHQATWGPTLSAPPSQSHRPSLPCRGFMASPSPAPLTPKPLSEPTAHSCSKDTAWKHVQMNSYVISTGLCFCLFAEPWNDHVVACRISLALNWRATWGGSVTPFRAWSGIRMKSLSGKSSTWFMCCKTPTRSKDSLYHRCKKI